MTYRDDAAALHAYHDSLVQELAGLDAQLGVLGATLAARERVAAELARVRGLLAASSPRLQPVRLARLKVASPCHESWQDMVGDDRVRHCGRCDKDVFNLSEMNAADAEALLARHGAAPCVRFFRRADGTVKTKDCPTQRPWLRGAVLAGAVAAGGIGGMFATTSMTAIAPVPFSAPPPVDVAPAPPEPALMGAIAVPVEIEVRGEPSFEMGDVAAPEVETKGKPSR